MDAKRLVPVLQILGGQVVEPAGAAGPRGLGHPAEWARRLELEGADGVLFQELDGPGRPSGPARAGWVREVAGALFIPFALEPGPIGWEDLEAVLAAGADRVFLPGGAAAEALVAAAAARFGRSRVGVAATLRQAGDRWRVAQGPDAMAWMAEMEQLGAGEILLRTGIPGAFPVPVCRGAAQLALALLVEGSGDPAQAAELLLEGADALAFPAREAGLAALKSALGGHGLTLRN